MHGCPNKTLGVGFLTGKEAWPAQSLHVTEDLPGGDDSWI